MDIDFGKQQALVALLPPPPLGCCLSIPLSVFYETSQDDEPLSSYRQHRIRTDYNDKVSPQCECTCGVSLLPIPAKIFRKRDIYSDQSLGSSVNLCSSQSHLS